MRKLLLTTIIGAMLVLGIPLAHADLNLKTTLTEPMTNATQEQWVTLMTHFVNANPLLGKDAVYVLNATGEQLPLVTCGSYQLVGPKPYITNNRTTAAPAFLPPWTATLVPTETFNTYCKSGVNAQGAVASYHGRLNAADHSFANTTFIIFAKPSE